MLHDDPTTAAHGPRPGEIRLHIALPTADLAAALEFYRALLESEPTKRRADYAKFEPGHPRVNLSLIEAPSEVTRAAQPMSGPRHFGLQVDSTAAVERIAARMRDAGFESRDQRGTTCCYAVQDKAWFADPDGNAWEVYVVLADSGARDRDSGGCCVDTPSGAAETRGSCC